MLYKENGSTDKSVHVSTDVGKCEVGLSRALETVTKDMFGSDRILASLGTS